MGVVYNLKPLYCRQGSKTNFRWKTKFAVDRNGSLLGLKRSSETHQESLISTLIEKTNYKSINFSHPTIYISDTIFQFYIINSLQTNTCKFNFANLSHCCLSTLNPDLVLGFVSDCGIVNGFRLLKPMITKKWNNMLW